MTRMRDIRLIDPAGAFHALALYRLQLDDMRQCYHPQTEEYRALAAAECALRKAADLITGEADFFGVMRRAAGAAGCGYPA